MYHSRRNFLKNSAMAVAATTLVPSDLFAAAKKKNITGLQLYSVREDMAKDPAGTLKQLAGMGYRYVEAAGYADRKFYGQSPKDFLSLLNGLGLKMYSGHTVLKPSHWDAVKKDFTDEWKWVVEDAAAVGQKYVISPWLDESQRKSYDDVLRFMEVFNKSGELCKKSGLKFGYHNHDFEFSVVLNDKKLYDIILQNTDPALVVQQLDMGNLYDGGAIAVAIVLQYPGRFELVHVKDMIKVSGGREPYESTVLGLGIVDPKQVMDQAKKTGGTHTFIIEQEQYQGKPPLDCAREDLAVMKKWGY
jgi:sugar phosphate isomerase/epimerase